MNMKERTAEVEKLTNCKITWEIGKIHEAFDKESYELVATYDPKSGKLFIRR